MKATRRKGQKRRIYDRDGGRCQYCGRELSTEEATLDHVKPRSRGGSNCDYNLALACAPCNQMKADQEPAEIGPRPSWDDPELRASIADLVAHRRTG